MHVLDKVCYKYICVWLLFQNGKQILDEVDCLSIMFSRNINREQINRGLQINREKTKMMSVNTGSMNEINVNNRRIKTYRKRAK